MVLPTFNLISLCSGGGMLDVGVHSTLARAGISARTICYVERDAHAAAALVARMEEKALDRAPIWSDVANFPAHKFAGRVDAVVAGIPCQGNSLAGKRLLEDDERNLWPVTRRLLRDVGAEWFFLENVYGFLVPDREAGRCAPIARVLGELAEDGWDAEWDVVSAEDVGASHERQRVFLLAHRVGCAGQSRHRNDTQRRRSGGAKQVGVGSGRVPAGAVAVSPSRGQRELRQPSERNGFAEWGGSELADDHDGRQRERPDATEPEPARGSGARIAPGIGGELPVRAVGDCSGERRRAQGNEQPRHGPRHADEAGAALPVFAPARNDYAGWLRVLLADSTLVPAVRRPDRSRVPSGAEVAESPVRLLSDGMARPLVYSDVGDPDERADELRLCGNGVVWQAAAEAYWRLWQRITEGHPGGVR